MREPEYVRCARAPTLAAMSIRRRRHLLRGSVLVGAALGAALLLLHHLTTSTDDATSDADLALSVDEEISVRPQQRPASVQVPPSPNEYKVILLATPFYSDTRWGRLEHQGAELTTRRRCPEPRCYVTTDSSAHGSTAAALVFHAPDMFGGEDEVVGVDVPLRRRDQAYVLLTVQPPTRYTRNMEAYGGFFNWIMSYRLDSDIFTPVPYGDLAEENVRWGGARRWRADGERKLVAYISDQCHTPSRREEFVAQLRRHVPVDTFGVCGGAACGATCAQNIESGYKFLLVLEDSLCTDYMSGTFYEWIFRDLVLVVLGDGPYSRLVPPGAFIDASRLAGPRELASLMLRIASNRSEYERFFAWREDWRPVGVFAHDPWCRLCHMLHSANASHLTTYEDLAHWWVDRGHCRTVRALYSHADFVAAPLPVGTAG